MDRSKRSTPFIGRYYHALEQKGRLLIPKSFRPAFGDSAVITLGLDGCLFLFRQDDWQEVVRQVLPLPLTQKKSRDWVRYLAGNAQTVTFDSLGRILIPESLRDAAKLTKDTVIVGSLSRLEIWDRDIYHRYFDQLNQNAESIAESINLISEEKHHDT